MSDGEVVGVGRERVVDPAAEQGGFHRAAPGRLGLGPTFEGFAGGVEAAFLDQLAGGGLGAVADALLVDVESDIVR